MKEQVSDCIVGMRRMFKFMTRSGLDEDRNIFENELLLSRDWFL